MGNWITSLFGIPHRDSYVKAAEIRRLGDTPMCVSLDGDLTDENIYFVAGNFILRGCRTLDEFTEQGDLAFFEGKPIRRSFKKESMITAMETRKDTETFSVLKAARIRAISAPDAVFTNIDAEIAKAKYKGEHCVVLQTPLAEDVCQYYVLRKFGVERNQVHTKISW